MERGYQEGEEVGKRDEERGGNDGDGTNGKAMLKEKQARDSEKAVLGKINKTFPK